MIDDDEPKTILERIIQAARLNLHVVLTGEEANEVVKLLSGYQFRLAVGAFDEFDCDMQEAHIVLGAVKI